MNVREEAAHYSRYRKVYDELWRAYMNGHISQSEYKSLRERVKAGDGEGAIKTLGFLLMYGSDGMNHV